jgi:hypothetical protein
LSHNAGKQNAITVPVLRWLLHRMHARRKNNVLISEGMKLETENKHGMAPFLIA